MTAIDFDQFLEAHLPGFAKFAAVLTGDQQNAHDVLADSLIKAWQRWNRISRMDSPVGYVRTIVTSTFLSASRTEQRRRATVLPHPVSVSAPDPAVGVVARTDITGRLRALTKAQRAAVVLRYYLDAPDVDIAAALGCSPATARSHLSHGLAALRRAAAMLGETS